MRNLKLCLVTERNNIRNEDFLNIIEQAVKAGVTIVQLREKIASTREFIMIGLMVKEKLDIYNIPLIINDRVDVSLAIKADGVHLGQTDMHPNEARVLLGDKAIIGISIENESQALEAEKLPINYIGASPLFTTSTKLDAAPPLGLVGLKRLRKISSYPIVAIGGINVNNTVDVIKAGANGIAVVSAIFKASDPYQAAKSLYNQVITCI